MLDSTVYLCGSVVYNKAPQQWYSTESLMISVVICTTVSHIAVLDTGATDIDVGFNLVMSQGIAVTIRTGSGNVARCDPVSCDRRCVVGCYTKDCESLTLWRRISMIGCILLDMVTLVEPVIIRYGLIPVTLAAWSLLFSGTKFEYILAAKPLYGWIPCLWNSS